MSKVEAALKAAVAGSAAVATGAAFAGAWPIAAVAGLSCAGAMAYLEGSRAGKLNGTYETVNALYDAGYLDGLNSDEDADDDKDAKGDNLQRYGVANGKGKMPVELQSVEGEIDPVLWQHLQEAVPTQEVPAGLVNLCDVWCGNPMQDGELQLVLGAEVVNGKVDKRRPVTAKLSEIGHVLDGGAPRSGKSVLVRSIIYQVLLANLERPAKHPTVMLGGIDLTGVTLNPALFNKLPQLFGGRVVSQAEDLKEYLDEVEQEVKIRERLFQEVDSLPEKLSEYNEAVPEAERLPYVVIFIEEFGALARSLGKKFQDQFATMVWRLPKYGFHFVCISQDLTKETIGASRDSFLVRAWFRSITGTTKEMLGFPKDLDVTENVQGRGIMKLADRSLEFQGTWVEKKDLIQLARMLKGIR